jgi:hypothetical protein
MKTKATELLGIEIPIFAFSHCRDVVIKDVCLLCRQSMSPKASRRLFWRTTSIPQHWPFLCAAWVGLTLQFSEQRFFVFLEA